MKRQNGFTLVEIAIVLVIIGMLVGGVLKGQDLIESAKAKNIAQDFRAISTAVLSYQDRFRALPGDDRGASARWGGACNVNGNSNGQIDGANWNGEGGTEPACAWEHLRRANLLTGDAQTQVGPTHADGGHFGIVSTPALAAVSNVSGSLIICAENVRGRHVAQLDTMLDDGNPATGSVRAVAASNAPAAAQSAALNESDSYNVCMGV
ncbi:type II secretion system protein [Niveibacterium sp. SC-1]|uniref:type II secretion system protein n=1 Tax=Niveibacterium sp. SC-1 TaxID=3135646 RepID=UPI00311D7ECA